jgi:hypothetical protein
LPVFADVDPTADLFGIFFDRLDGHAVTWGSPFPSLPGDLPVVTGNGVLRRCGVTSGDVGMAVRS